MMQSSELKQGCNKGSESLITMTSMIWPGFWTHDLQHRPAHYDYQEINAKHLITLYVHDLASNSTSTKNEWN